MQNAAAISVPVSDVPTSLESVQIMNLRNNHEKHRASARQIDNLGDRQDLTIEMHDRGHGSIAYYAMLDGRPIAYCVGHQALKAMKDRGTKRDRFIISSTFVHPAHRQHGVGLTLYLSIVGDVELLVSDWELSDGAEALWARLRNALPYGKIMHADSRYFARHWRQDGKKDSCNG